MTSDAAETGLALDAIHDVAGYLKARFDAVAPGVCVGAQLRRDANSDADLRCYFSDKAWLKSAACERALQALASDPAVGSASRKGGFVFVKLDDGFLRHVQERAAGDGLRADLATILAGQHHAIQFLDPNANKAFHLGHMYEGVLGHGLASACEMAGARVTRQCFVSDIGRSVCEAMAGCQQARGAQDPVAAGMKSDHYVGMRYVEFLEGFYASNPSGVDDVDPVGRELHVRGDAADRLLAGWLAGDPATRELWGRVREWVLAGQRESLARLDIRVDRYDHGSEMDGHIASMVSRGLERGLLRRDETNAVLYESGKSEYETVVILRADGFPTEHARQLGHIMHMQPAVESLDGYVTLMGSEWQHAFAVYEDLVRGLGSNAYHDLCRRLCHGMVIVSGSTMKSVAKAVVRWDDFLETVATKEQAIELARESNGAVDPTTIAAIVIKTFFLTRKGNKPIAFSWDTFMSRKHNPGWAVAAAWSKLASAAEVPVAFQASLERPEARLFTLFILRARVLLAEAVREYDLSSLVQYLVDLCEACVRTSWQESFHPLVAETLRTVMSCCGLVSPERSGSA
jgi:arginyl-tRNA synthetase